VPQNYYKDPFKSNSAARVNKVLTALMKKYRELHILHAFISPLINLRKV